MSARVDIRYLRNNNIIRTSVKRFKDILRNVRVFLYLRVFPPCIRERYHKFSKIPLKRSFRFIQTKNVSQKIFRFRGFSRLPSTMTTNFPNRYFLAILWMLRVKNWTRSKDDYISKDNFLRLLRKRTRICATDIVAWKTTLIYIYIYKRTHTLQTRTRYVGVH